MDLFVYQDLEFFTGGKPITGYRTATWVERWQTPGEFKIEAPLSSGLRTLLPVDSVIGKVQSLDLMIVENVEITEDPEDEPQITISGRSYTSFMERRTSGFSTVDFDGMPYKTLRNTQTHFSVAVGDLYNRLWYLIRACLDTSLDANNDISSLNIVDNVPIATDGTPYTNWPADNLLKLVNEQLASWGIGIRTYRRNMFPNGGVNSDDLNTQIALYIGEDKTATVKFIPQTGDIESANYLFTNRNHWTGVMVKGRWYSVMVPGDETGFERRTTIIDGSDIDNDFDTAPSEVSSDYATLVQKMVLRGQDFLARSKQILLVSANISENNRYRFRTDYDIGDIVTLDTPYGEALTMRVTEFAEVEDENGETGYPTLSVYTPPVGL